MIQPAADAAAETCFADRTLEDALLRLHAFAMCRDNPQRAATGRLGKDGLNLLARWLSDELGRGTEPMHIMGAGVDTMLSLICTLAGTLAAPGRRAEALGLMVPGMLAILDQAIAMAETSDAECRGRR